MNSAKLSRLNRSALWQGVLGFALVCGLLVTVDQLSMHYGLDGSQRIVDDLLGGLLAGTIVYLYERHRQRLLVQKLHVINLMNHHIRNALQPIILAMAESGNDRQTKVVEDCVSRIDWALRDILPGKIQNPPFH